MRVGARAARRLVLVGGDQAWGETWVVDQLGAADLRDALWVADRAPAGVQATPAAKVVGRLGSEHGVLIFNAHQGFHPDAFAAAVGGLRGGGDCVVLVPPVDTWAAFADPDLARFAAYPRGIGDMRGGFLGRLARLWQADPATLMVTPGAGAALRLAPPAPTFLRLNAEQAAAVAAVARVALGHARRPLVLTADRGRGKSTVLGVAAAGLLTGRLQQITVVAPHRAAAAILFRHACAAAGVPDRGVADVSIGRGILHFRLPAELIRDGLDAPGLVLVDEAAAIPVAVLRGLLEQHNRLVFASTVHGYEGSGRGFEIRFKADLQRRMPQWRGMALSQPVRWPAGDPLEALVDRAFLLDADLGKIAGRGAVTIYKLAAAELLADEALLRAAFGLLVNAHYQTRPSDLRQLLDNPDVHVWLGRTGGDVCGVLMAVSEGGFDAAMAERVVSGARRPRGHLLPQSLAVHAGLGEALTQRLLRVQRIAVHPALQRRGIGRLLLQAVAEWGAGRHIDALGCAYGVDAALLAFWSACDFRPARLGVRIDPASAAHSLFMLRGLSIRGEQLATLGQRQFQAQLPWALSGSLNTLDSRLAAHLLRGRDCADLGLSEREWRELDRVAAGARQPATADALIWKLLVQTAAAARAPIASLAPLLAWQLQRHPVDRVCRDFAIDGRRALEVRLRALISTIATAPGYSG